MSIPNKLKNFNVFLSGVGFAGKADITLPDLAIKTEDHRAGGMDGTVAIDMGMEKIDAKVTFHEYNADVIKLFGQADRSASGLMARGALRDGEGNVTPVLVEMRGMCTKISGGDWKAGDSTTQDFEINCDYYRFNLDGADLHEIDVVNMKRLVDGVDQLEAERAAIGV